ncbi:hypothetical protein PHLCEN_2v7257 [Hermanssonia centrifuga]|uniref:Uncharacterized protein n=1 Tax=Hermanssonia centrifuga TaxID=98765 RepID=A0A2R6NX24_9APHY|nr:hypothetical protein PHLCEN_2v7257 [Hermanssonia centrifuga]
MIPTGPLLLVDCSASGVGAIGTAVAVTTVMAEEDGLKVETVVVTKSDVGDGDGEKAVVGTKVTIGTPDEGAEEEPWDSAEVLRAPEDMELSGMLRWAARGR